MNYEYIGNLHLHTTHSDGSATMEEVVRAAQAAELDFVIPTDHNIYLPGLDGWHGRTLLLIGEEVHDTARQPQANHYLVFEAYEDMAAYAPDPQQLIDEVCRRGGFGFIAHPFEHAAPRFNEPEIPWVDWQVSGYQGISIWNYMSEFKSHLHNIPSALWATYFPRTVIRGPFAKTLNKWDELLQTRRAPAIGASDAHGIRYKLGPLRGLIFPYEYLFCTSSLLSLSTATGGETKRLSMARSRWEAALSPMTYSDGRRDSVSRRGLGKRSLAREGRSRYPSRLRWRSSRRCPRDCA
jgi:hypothetical protein